MCISFCFSNHIETLFQNFIEDINYDNKKTDPFYSPVVLTPNINLRKWIQLNTAKINDICININFMFLEQGLTYLIKKITGLNDELENQYLFLSHKENHIYLQLIILSIILNSGSDKDLAHIHEYLKSPDKKNFAKKTWQLSEKLTYYFREYEYHREIMINNWSKDINCIDSDVNYNKIEIFQKKLYRIIFFEKELKNKFKNNTGKEYTTLPQYSKKFLKMENKNPKKENIYLFGFSQVSRFHYELIFNLEKFYNIKIFQLNFFDEDISTNNELLKSWGNPLKESIEILKSFNKNDENNKYTFIKQKKKVIPEPTLLNLLQNNILNNSIYDIETKKINCQDTSIQVAGCPGIYREVETVYNSIIYNLNNDNTLKLTDIAVLVYDMRKYNNIIRSVFDKIPDIDFSLNSDIIDKPYISYNLSDSNAYMESIFGNALIKGLELANGKFSRKEIFDFILNPCFLKSQNISRIDASTWLSWVDKLNIYFGYNEKDKKRSSNSDNDLFTWSYGLKRLKFGRIMSDYEFEGKVKSFQGIIPFSDIKSQDQIQLNKFIKVIESLFSFLISIQGSKTGKEWIELINSFIDKFLDIPEEIREEKYVLYKIVEDINKLDIFDKLFKSKIELDYIIEFIKTHLTDIPSKSGKYLTDGITISSFMPARPIPFKIIYILGLNEKEFPGYKDYSTLDLRNAKKRLTGDVTKPEANNYLFLETLLSVREKLYITYISKDLQKDEVLYPSPSCTKLINYLNNNFLENEFEIIEIPLKGESLKYFDKFPVYQDIINNYFYTDKLLALLHLKDIYNFDTGQLNEIEEKYLKTQNIFENKKQDLFKKEITNLSLTDLYRFILNPSEAQIKKFIEIYNDQEDDLAIKEDEPFYTQYPVNFQIITDCLNKYITNIKDQKKFSLESYYVELYDYNKILGNTPEQVYREIDRTNIYNIIDARIYDEKKGINNFLNNNSEYVFFEKIIINDDFSPGDLILTFPSLNFKITTDINEKKEIILNGELENIILNKKNSTITSIIIVNSAKFNKKYVIKPVLFYLLLLCGNKKNNNNISSGEFIKNFKFIMKIFCAEETKEFELYVNHKEAIYYIKSLIKEFLFDLNFDYLPFEIITDSKYLFPPQEDNEYTERLIKTIENKINDTYSYYKEMKIFELINRVVPVDAYQKIKERYKFFSRIFKNGDKV